MCVKERERERERERKRERELKVINLKKVKSNRKLLRQSLSLSSIITHTYVQFSFFG